MMKINLIAILTFAWIIPQLASGQNITVSGDSKIEFKEEVVSILLKDLMAKNPSLDLNNFKIIEKKTKKELPYQLEYNGNKEQQNLLVLLSLNKKPIDIKIVTGKPSQFKKRTFARYVPERLDDFAWENDKIAYRAYGKALEGTKGDAYGLDVWVKRTSDLIIDRRYKHGDYHHDLGDGLDYYHVGRTLGAGNIAPIVKDEIIYSKNYHRWQIIDSGAIRTTFILEYDAWDVNGIAVTVTKKISIDAGSQMNKIEVMYNFSGQDTLPVVIGIIKRPEQGHITIDEKEGISSYWEPMHGPDGTTGVATILPSPVTASTITKEQILMHTTYRRGRPFIYYMGAAWDKAGEIKNAAQWNDYVQLFKAKLTNPLKVVIK
jgi:hypothetical protein